MPSFVKNKDKTEEKNVALKKFNQAIILVNKNNGQIQRSMIFTVYGTIYKSMKNTNYGLYSCP